ncbi:MAG: hypothetical protein OCD01_05030 [Fibrobacterales bacterium]
MYYFSGTQMQHLKNDIRSLVFLIGVCVSALFAEQQTYLEYWAAVPSLTTHHGANYGTLQFASLGGKIEVTASMPAQNIEIGSVVIEAGMSGAIELPTIANNSSNSIESGLPGRLGILDDRGIHITSRALTSGGDARFSAYIDRYGNANRDILSLKGESALGYSFTIPGRDRWRNGTFRDATNSFDIVATEDSTRITIDLSIDIEGHDKGAAIQIVLNKGESFTAAARKTDAILSYDHVGGSYVESDKPIVIMYKDDSVDGDSHSPSGRDALGDQLVPDELGGREYIYISGTLSAGEFDSDNDGLMDNGLIETAFVTAIDNGTTTILYNGTEYALDGKGDVLGIPMSEGANYFEVKERNKKVHVFQGTGTGREVGGSVLPPITCTGSSDVTVTRTQDPSGTDRFNINLLAKKSIAANFEYSIDNSSFTTLSRNAFDDAGDPDGEWVYLNDRSQFRDLLQKGAALRIKNDLSLSGQDRFHLGVDESNGSGSKVGYFSSFYSVKPRAGIKDLGNYNYTLRCKNRVPIIATGGTSFDWDTQSIEPFVKEISEDTLEFYHQTGNGNGPFDFSVTVKGNECSDEDETLDLTIKVDHIDDVFSNRFMGCQGDTLTLNPYKDAYNAGDIDQYVTWTSNTSYLNSTSSATPIVDLPLNKDSLVFDVDYDDGHCEVNSEVVVIAENCGECRLQAAVTQDTICAGESVTLSADGRGDFYEWYSVDASSDKITQSAPLVSPLQTTSFIVSYNNAIKETPSDPWADDVFCQDTVTVVVKSCVSPRIVLAEIFDTDGDGTAETMEVTFNRVPDNRNEEVTSIDWPKEGQDDIDADADMMDWIDTNIVRIDLTGKLKRGTEASEDNPPFVTYNGKDTKITDRVSPVIVEAVIKPSEYPYYAVKIDDDSTQIIDQSDTLFLYLSEKVTFDRTNGILLQIISEEGHARNLILKDHIVDVYDDYTWKIVPDYRNAATRINLGDSVAFVINSGVEDKKGNEIAQTAVVVTGESREDISVHSIFRSSVIGVGDVTYNQLPTITIPVLDEDNEPLDETIVVSIELNDTWVPAWNFSEGAYDDQATCEDTQDAIAYIPACGASLVVSSFVDQGPYTASVHVSDHLGQHIAHWQQRFGDCGELENSARLQDIDTKGSVLNDLYWNIKDSHGRRVGSGVYHWNVIIQFDNGLKTIFNRNMGVARSRESCEWDE